MVAEHFRVKLELYFGRRTNLYLLEIDKGAHSRRALYELLLIKGVPHQFSSGLEIFQNKQLTGKIQGTPYKNNRSIVHKI